MFLRRAAREASRTGFLGVERAGKFFDLCAQRLERDDLPNARLVRADAYDLLSRWIIPGSIGALHIYFPDPWPKKRHAKRRMLSPPLFDLAARAIAEEGHLVIASDVEWYFAESLALLHSHPCFEPAALDPLEPQQLATHYAIKYQKEGRTLQRARFVRNASAAPPPPTPASRRRPDAGTAPAPARAGEP